MSNRIPAFNRDTSPLAPFGQAGYGALSGWSAVPPRLTRALTPTLAPPPVTGLPARQVFLMAGGLALFAGLLLMPLHLPSRQAVQ